MKTKLANSFSWKFSQFSNKVTRISGSSTAFIAALAVIVIWAVTGPIFHFSDTWQLVINTGTTIITFLMVFIIQQTQNKDTVAMHLKLNELISANENASNRLVDIEDLTDEELQMLKKFYVKLAKLAERDRDVFSSHSIDEAEANQQYKTERKKPVETAKGSNKKS
jgi:low affinity Fe/Cu permease